MSRVMELEEQIKKLQEEKSKVFADERAAALSDIKGKIALFQFSAKELGFKVTKVASTLESRKLKKEVKNAAKKTAKKTSRKPYKASGIYFDLDGKKVPATRGRPPKEVSAYAAEKGVTPDSLKRNADGTPLQR